MNDKRLSDDLRDELYKCFALGFFDRMAGFEVNEDDFVETNMAQACHDLAHIVVDGTAEKIAMYYRESPEHVRRNVYEAGVSAFEKIELAHASRN